MQLSDRLSTTVDVIIPAWNEERSLPLVLRALPSVRRVVVVDNASTDRTAEVARSLGADVVTQPQRGYGAACLKGLQAIRDSRDLLPPEIVVFLDADFSDDPAWLSRLVQPILEDRADFVLGSRLSGEREPGAMPWQSVWGNRLACWLMHHLFGATYADLGPFRAIRYFDLCRLGMSDTNFGWTIEMQIKATRWGLRTVEIPVPYRCRVGTSKISGTISGSFKAGAKILYTVAKYGLQYKVHGSPDVSTERENRMGGNGTSAEEKQHRSDGRFTDLDENPCDRTTSRTGMP